MRKICFLATLLLLMNITPSQAFQLLLLSSLTNHPVSTHNISPHNLNKLPARDDLNTVIDTCEQRTDSS